LQFRAAFEDGVDDAVGLRECDGGHVRLPVLRLQELAARVRCVQTGRHDGAGMMELHTAGHRRGVVAAPHGAAVEAGRLVLAEGGNALEAMVAMAACIAAVYPHMNHVGGDGFWVVREPKGRVRAIMAAGRAGANARRELYRDHATIPPRGPLAALTVPGAVSGWMLALEMARAQGGRLPLDVLLAPAIRHARKGYAVSRGQARLTADKLPEMAAVPGFHAAFLIDGKPPAAGALLKQEALAATLDHLAHAGLADFYRGDVGREIAADLERIGSPVTRTDLERHEAMLAEPLSVQIRAGTLYNTPPPTQGLASLMILALFERLRIDAAESFEHVHGIVEATKRAFVVRDRVITDPARVPHPVEPYLEPKFLDAETLKIDRRKAAKWPPPGGTGDTVWMGATDASGLVISYIQSLYWEFGSGCVLPRTGVLMQNRGASFSLDPASLNALAPGRLPFHTLNPALAVLGDGRIMAYGTMGGDGQPQTQAALFTRHVLYREPLDRAIEAPRWLLGRTWGSTVTSLRIEPRFEEGLIDRLMSAGHEVEVMPEPYSDLVGHAGAVVLHPDGALEGAHDPRADGGAAGD
jgi:gamma-glutamyltranspeptidase/glutathione hydrolase